MNKTFKYKYAVNIFFFFLPIQEISTTWCQTFKKSY